MRPNRSNMHHRFSQAPQATIQRSTFDRSCSTRTTFDSGYLIPVFIDEALPGDTFSISLNALGRLATPIFPFMDNLYLDFHFFAVPNRLVWNNWERFNGAQDNPGDSTDFLIPTITSPTINGYDTGSIYDYFGIPVNTPNLPHNVLPLRCYNLIWNEWFRDENLQDSVPVFKGDTGGGESSSTYTLLRRNKRYDYFTSCLPWPQKGAAVLLPLGGEAPIVGDGSPIQFTTASSPDFTDGMFGMDSSINAARVSNYGATMGFNPVYWQNTGLVADLSVATATTINSIRQAFQVQRLLERDARGGTRYVEILKSHFGVTSPDFRLQRPEYLGHFSQFINVTPVPQTSSVDGQPSPQGNLAAFGTVTVDRHVVSKSFVEHCYIIGLASVRADLNYQQGLDRLWSRSTRYDFYWSAFSHLGEQAVLNQEIYAQDGSNLSPGTSTPINQLPFGYQERYAEYRYKNSLITGQFRSQYVNTLDPWHLAQYFVGLPQLNSEFIQENPPVDRVLALSSPYPQLKLDMYFRMKCARPMPVFSVPGYVDHF